MIQVRNVPPELHRELKRRARLSGKSLTAYIQEILEREVEHLPAEEYWEQFRERIKGRRSKATTEDVVAWIRELRGPLPPH
ncbi:MAG TPA: toxin-antitoxin system HicB family antitoxin [Actinomycetota bacterium]|nr:toxin-antitoxin system HicB family antitoxin [Actinomycetota bacterium]